MYKRPRSIEEIKEIASRLKRGWVAGDPIRLFLRSRISLIDSLINEECVRLSDIGAALTEAGIVFKSGHAWNLDTLKATLHKARQSLPDRDQPNAASSRLASRTATMRSAARSRKAFVVSSSVVPASLSARSLDGVFQRDPEDVISVPPQATNAVPAINVPEEAINEPVLAPIAKSTGPSRSDDNRPSDEEAERQAAKQELLRKWGIDRPGADASLERVRLHPHPPVTDRKALQDGKT